MKIIDCELPIDDWSHKDLEREVRILREDIVQCKRVIKTLGKKNEELYSIIEKKENLRTSGKKGGLT